MLESVGDAVGVDTVAVSDADDEESDDADDVGVRKVGDSREDV